MHKFSATPPLRHARITVILLLVSMTLLLLKNSLIPLHQSSNFVQSPSNHPGSGTILFGIIACALLFTVTGASTSDIFMSICLYSSKALFLIHKDPSHSDNTSILSVLLELVLASLHSLHYTCFVCRLAVTLPSFICEIFYYTSLVR